VRASPPPSSVLSLKDAPASANQRRPYRRTLTLVDVDARDEGRDWPGSRAENRANQRSRFLPLNPSRSFPAPLTTQRRLDADPSAGNFPASLAQHLERDKRLSHVIDSCQRFIAFEGAPSPPLPPPPRKTRARRIILRMKSRRSRDRNLVLWRVALFSATLDVSGRARTHARALARVRVRPGGRVSRLIPLCKNMIIPGDDGGSPWINVLPAL